MLYVGDPRLHRLIDAYRDHGHLKARLDPLGLGDPAPLAYPLHPQGFGLPDSGEQFSALQELLPAFSRTKGCTSDVVDYLEHMYCGGISLEVAHISVGIKGPTS